MKFSSLVASALLAVPALCHPVAIADPVGLHELAKKQANIDITILQFALTVCISLSLLYPGRI